MKRELLRKYFIMGSQNCERDPREILIDAIKSGITIFQYREKGEGALVGEEKVKLGHDLREICRRHQIPFIINDDVELAETLNVDGIHVGQDDESVDLVRKRYPDKMIGLSISNESELESSRLDLIDYIGAGPVFDTGTKEDAKKPVGVKWIQHIRDQYPDLPIVGIGGINDTNAQQVIQAGADGVAIISAITQSPDIYATVQRL